MCTALLFLRVIAGGVQPLLREPGSDVSTAGVGGFVKWRQVSVTLWQVSMTR